MMSPTHIAGGIAITGIVTGQFCEQNIFATVTNITCCVVCSLLPDIDMPTSPIARITGNKFFKHANYIQDEFGHRTITHSIYAIIAITFLSYLLGLSYSICGWAYFSHILLDMLTKNSVSFLYPHTLKKARVLPKNWRLSTDNKLHETILLILFIILTSFTYPLMQQGFWTTINNSFGNLATLYSEFKKSDKDLLEVDYTYIIANQEYHKKGYVINAVEDRTWILNTIGKQDFFILDERNGIKVKDIKATHTHRKYFINRFDFYTINADSLNRICQHNLITEIDIQATKPYNYTENNLTNTDNKLKKEYPSVLHFAAKDTAIKADTFFILPNTSIPIKQNEIQNIKAEYQQKLVKYQNTQAEIQRILADTTKDYLIRENQLQRLKDLRSIKEPELDVIRIRSIEFEISILQQNEQLQNQIKRYEYERREMEKRERFTPTLFSGYVKILTVVSE